MKFNPLLPHSPILSPSSSEEEGGIPEADGATIEKHYSGRNVNFYTKASGGIKEQPSPNKCDEDEYERKIHEQVARMSKAQRALIRETFNTYLDTENIVKNGVAVMLKLFSEFPHYKSIWPQFRAIPDSSLMDAEAVLKHAVTFAGGLRSIINSMEDNEKLKEALGRIARAHIKWGICRSHVMHLLPALLEVMEENACRKLGRETREAWSILFDVIANLLDIVRICG